MLHHVDASATVRAATIDFDYWKINDAFIFFSFTLFFFKKVANKKKKWKEALEILKYNSDFVGLEKTKLN